VKPQRPYLLRALYEWIVDSGDVPDVLVDAEVEEIQVPSEHVENGQIVLNLGPNAVRDLVMEQDYVMCTSRFGGRPYELYLPMAAIRAIYGRDTQQGMVFPEEELLAAKVVPDQNPDNPSPDDDKPTLRLV
jgi:stringent starvation protein B